MGEGLSPYEPNQESKKRPDLSRLLRHLTMGAGVGSVLAGTPGLGAAEKMNPVQEELMQKRANAIIATRDMAVTFFPEQVKKVTQPDGSIKLVYEGKPDLSANMLAAIEASPLLTRQVHESRAKNESPAKKIAEIIKQRSALIDKIDGISADEKEAMKQKMAVAVATTYRLSAHKLPESESVVVGEQPVNGIDTTGELVWVASESTDDLYDLAAKLPNRERAQVLGGCNGDFVKAGFIGAMELAGEQGVGQDVGK